MRNQLWLTHLLKDNTEPAHRQYKTHIGIYGRSHMFSCLSFEENLEVVGITTSMIADGVARGMAFPIVIEELSTFLITTHFFVDYLM